MPSPVTGAGTYTDSQTLIEKRMYNHISTLDVNCPMVKKYRVGVRDVPTKIEWTQKAIGKPKVTISANYTAGSGQMQLAAATDYSPYRISNGKSIVITPSRAVYRVDSFNSTTRIAQVTHLQGTDVNVSSGSTLFLSKKTPIGSKFSGESELSFASLDYNYIDNFDDEIVLDSLAYKKRYKSEGTYELSFEYQADELLPDVMGRLENALVRGNRLQGTGGTSKGAGFDASAGGILFYNATGGGYTVTASTQFSRSMIATDMRQLRLRGGFNARNATNRNNGQITCDMFVSEAMLQYANDVVYADVHGTIKLDKKQNGTFGYFFYEFLENGVKVRMHVSDALNDDEVIYIPNASQVELLMYRFFEPQPDDVYGDGKVRMYSTTWSVKVHNPWTIGYRKNVGTY